MSKPDDQSVVYKGMGSTAFDLASMNVPASNDLPLQNHETKMSKSEWQAQIETAKVMAAKLLEPQFVFVPESRFINFPHFVIVRYDEN